MKQFKLSAKFYIIFSLIFSIPASDTASWLQSVFNNFKETNILRYFAEMGIIEVPTAVIILLFLFWVTDKWVWRIPGLTSLLRLPDNINGRYEGDLVSSYDKDRKVDKTYKIVLEIKQSLTEIKVNLYTNNSCSYSLVASVGKNNQDNWELCYLYQNKTSTVNHDEDMKDHGGAAFLKIFDDGLKLKGNYFNNPRDRGRHGNMDLKYTGRKLLGRFE